MSKTKSRWSRIARLPIRSRRSKQNRADTFARGESCIGHGSVLIAAITSCTNTSNPSVMLAAGLLAKKAVERGLTIDPAVKTSLAPGSRVVSDYLQKTGLQTYLDQLGFNIVGYGCTTCIGNSGPLHPKIEQAISEFDLVAASVLSGNRNFEARVHQNIKANFLMSPPLVVAFALAGRVDLDLSNEPIGKDADGREVFLRDLWPSLQEIRDTMQSALTPEVFRRLYRDFAGQNPKWNEIPSSTGDIYQWDEKSDYIHEPPFFQNFSMEPGKIEEIRGARPLGIFGDSVTTDHISPAGAIKATSPAGQYLISRGINAVDFNSYGSRRGNDLVMTRGTFANVRIKNLMVPGVEGGVTKYFGNRIAETGETMSIFDAAMKYQADGIPLVILAGHEYGTGSIARLGGERNAIARGEGGGRGEFRADSSVESGRDGRAAAAIRRGHKCAVARPGWIGDVRDHRFVRRDRARANGHARNHAQRWKTRSRSGEAADRYPDRDRLLSPRRHSAVRPARVDGAAAR